MRWSAPWILWLLVRPCLPIPQMGPSSRTGPVPWAGTKTTRLSYRPSPAGRHESCRRWVAASLMTAPDGGHVAMRRWDPTRRSLARPVAPRLRGATHLSSRVIAPSPWGRRSASGRSTRCRSAPHPPAAALLWRRGGGPAHPHHRLQERRAVGGTEPGARIPAVTGAVVVVVTGRDVSEGGRVPVERREERRHGRAQLLLEQRRQTGPQGSHGTRPAHDRRLPVDEHPVAGRRIGHTRDVGHAATDVVRRSGRPRRGRHPGLEARYGIDAADASAGAAPVGVPHRFSGDRTVGGSQPRATATHHMRTRRRVVGVDVAVVHAVGRQVVTRCRVHRRPDRRRGQERLVHRLPGLRRPPARVLRQAPADRDDRRLVHLVVDGGEDRVGEALQGVVREVDDDVGVRDRPDDLDVEGDLAVRVCGSPVGRLAARPTPTAVTVGGTRPSSVK